MRVLAAPVVELDVAVEGFDDEPAHRIFRGGDESWALGQDRRPRALFVQDDGPVALAGEDAVGPAQMVGLPEEGGREQLHVESRLAHEFRGQGTGEVHGHDDGFAVRLDPDDISDVLLFEPQ